METISMANSYQDSSTGNVPTSSDDETSSHRPAFQRCHRLQARLEAVSAGLCELNMLRERQERLVMEAMCLPLSCVEDGEEIEEDKRKNEKRKEADFENKQENEGTFTDPTQLMGNLVGEVEVFDVVINAPDASIINSETSSRKSSGFFEALDTDIFVQSRKNSAAEVSAICPETTTSCEVRRQVQGSAGRKLSAYSLDGDVRRLVQNRAETSSLPDYDAITSAKLSWNFSAEKVIASDNHDSKSVGIKRSMSVKTARKLSYSGETGPESSPWSKPMDGSRIVAKRRPCLIRSTSVPEPRNNMNTSESISKEELIRRKRRSVHEIDFSLQGQPGLASQCYMGSSRAFRYPSPLHAISLQSPLCLPGPGYNEKTTDIDATEVTESGTKGDCISSTITEEKSSVGELEQYFEVFDDEIQAPTMEEGNVLQAPTKATCTSLVAGEIMDRQFSPTRPNNKLISHSDKTKEASPLRSHYKSPMIVTKEPENKTCHMSVDMEQKNQNGANSSVHRTNQKPRPQIKEVQEQDIKASDNYNMVTSYDNEAHLVPGCKHKQSNLDSISSKDTNFKRSQNYFELEKGDVRYTKQVLTPGRKTEYPNRENRHMGDYLSRENHHVRSNFSSARNSHIDSNGHYNDGVVRSKTHARKSLSRGGAHQSEAGPGMKESQRMVVNFDDSKQDLPRPQPKRKNACVTPVEIWRVEYGV